ncbi:hypothetical protein ONZ45_g8648 [Pleurotus djamor]|nr:hypothetical protein ONZ45_g8648 [Pleurotus djamor]
MHDSLPKGNLEELLGKVPLYTKPKNPSDALPNFPSDEDHPYHIVVVAGQECPSTLGIPMGFGAGFKLIDREKDKDWDREEGSNSSQKRDDDEDDDAPKSRKSTDNDAGSPSSGWTAMVEHWLCHGGGAPSSVDSSAQSTTSCSTRKGPYSMLIKQRLMGLYLSVYVHRDVRSLVKGASKSYVKAGLIGGRVGNKGGVGISLNIAGATILFLNAHLAAHEGKVNHRLANLAKIKAELSVEDFLAQDDPRTFSEDLTDKFDYTFIFGDLNFRLDISRLHADWLISHQDYTNALEFDQLRKLLKEKQYFQGFTEALINFPPTFKYDVLRTLKRPHKTKMSYSMSAIPTMVMESEKEGNEHDRVGRDDEDRASISTSFTSQSRVTDAEDDSDIHKIMTSPLLSRAFSTPGSRVSLNAAAHKVKEKWISLLSSPRQKPSSPPALPRSSTQAPILPPIHPTAADPLTTSWSLPSLPLVEASTVDDSPPQPPPVVDGTLLQAAPLTRVPSRKSLKDKDAEAGSDDEDRDKGVYDSSHKKRVPSWQVTFSLDAFCF